MAQADPILITAARECITRQRAKALGLRRYFTGKPCKYGHVAERSSQTCICVECDRRRRGCPKKAKQARRLWGLKNKDKLKQALARWRAAHPDIKRERARLWYAQNRERLSLHYAARWKANLEENRRRARLRQNQHPERAAIARHLRRARKASAGGRFTAEDIARIRKLQRNRCAECRNVLTKATTHIDHIVPLSKGGSNYPQNLQLLCATCNISKGARDPITHSRRKGRLL